MDLATIVGLAGAMAMIALAMVLAGGIGMFYNLPSILIVIGGTIFVVLQKYTLQQFLGAGKVAGKAYSFKSTPPLALIEEIVELADLARKGGLLS
ncbi:MAG: flagellar motor protein PomA, partial [Pseudomonadales bacterium]|nr:flagellar motor protein PomA [Pseudomonadales bacterium]